MTADEQIDAMLDQPGSRFICLLAAYIPIAGALITGWLM